MKRITTLCSAAVVALVATGSAALEISDYYSPWNSKRPKRPSTKYIILHTTEGPKKGSLSKVRRNGETHYFVDTRGHVYRIIHRSRIATHAGRSMWNGKSNIDNSSIGIEVVGYHDRDITEAQYKAVRELLDELQRIYKIKDKDVLCHAMVAYGTPNRWHKRSHRGRKRCGMLFQDPAVRKKLGLTGRQTYDPDVRAGRLAVGDAELAKALYGPSQRATRKPKQRSSKEDPNVVSRERTAWHIARDAYNSPDTIYMFPDGTKKRGNRIDDWTSIPVGTRIVLSPEKQPTARATFKEIGKHGKTAREIAGSEYQAKTTMYFLVDGRIRRGDQLKTSTLDKLPKGTRMLVGYVYGGYVSEKRSAFSICGTQWNYPSTVYRFPDGTIKTGDKVKEDGIPHKTLVFFRN